MSDSSHRERTSIPVKDQYGRDRTIYKVTETFSAADLRSPGGEGSGLISYETEHGESINSLGESRYRVRNTGELFFGKGGSATGT